MATAYSALSLPLDDTGDGKVINRFFDSLYAAIPAELSSTFSAEDSVHTIAADTDISAGNWTITVTLQNGETFTTASIAFDANAATIEGAIDTAATAASVTDWTNGDIAVTGGGVDTADVVLTFSGDSVTGQYHDLTTVADVDLVGGTVSVVTRTTGGHPDAATLQIASSQSFLTIGTVSDLSTWSWNRLVPKPEKSVWEFVARAAVVETQQPDAFTTVLDLGGFIKPAQPRA